MIPRVYDTDRAVRCIDAEGSQRIVTINKILQKDGKMQMFNLGVGLYDVAVTTGPSHTTKRQEAVESMLDLIKAYPASAQATADLMVRNMDWPGHEEIADRLEKLLPPGMASNDEENKQPLPPQVKQAMDQQSQMIQQLSQQLHAAMDVIENKKLELSSKERIAFADIQAKIEIELARMGQKSSATLLEHEVNRIQTLMDQATQMQNNLNNPTTPLQSTQPQGGAGGSSQPGQMTAPQNPNAGGGA
jgi:hypothetical protein